MRQYRKASLFFLIGSLICTSSGCSNINENTSSVQTLDNISTYQESSSSSNTSLEESVHIQNEYQSHEIVFPISEKGKTEDNAKIYAIDPFTLNIDLPKGWTTKEADQPVVSKYEPHYLNNGLFSLIDIFNDKNECIGTVGFNIYEPYEGEEENPESIYSFIALGTGYQIDVREAYMPIKTTDTGVTAISDVLYSESFLSGMLQSEEDDLLKCIKKSPTPPDREYLLEVHDGWAMFNKAVLSYNRDLKTYIAIELDVSVADEALLKTIAKSIVLE